MAVSTGKAASFRSCVQCEPVRGRDGLDFGLQPVLVLAHAAEAVGHAAVVVSSNAEVL